MISLTNNSSTTTTKLQAFLSGAAATTNPTVTVVSYIVPPQSKPDFAEYRSAPQFTVLAGATETDIADAPPSGSVKDIIYVSIYNADTAAVTVTVCIDDNATNRILCKVTLGVASTLYYEDDRGWYVIDANGAAVVSNSFAVSPITNSISGDVALNNTANYFTGPTVAQGTTGTWFVSGTVTVIDTAGAARFDAKMWDGTTVIDSVQIVTSGINILDTMALSGFITSPAGNLRISVRDETSTSGTILANASSNAKDSTITAIRIA